MKGFIIWFVGFLPGIPVGFLLRMLTQRKEPKKRCKFVRESKDVRDEIHFDRCIGEESAPCIDHLCPKHCQEMHGDNCSPHVLAAEPLRTH